LGIGYSLSSGYRAQIEGPAGRVPQVPELQQCAICFDSTAPEAGIKCRGDGQHFICNGCFDRHVAVTCAAGNAAAFSRTGCRIFCPMRPCTAAAPKAAAGSAPQQYQPLPFADRQVALHVDEGTLQAYEAAKRDAYLAQGQRTAQQPSQSATAPPRQQGGCSVRAVLMMALRACCRRCCRA
jgi:hypothetical protein